MHFRNVLMKVPREQYIETFLDAGVDITKVQALLGHRHLTGCVPRLVEIRVGAGKVLLTQRCGGVCS